MFGATLISRATRIYSRVTAFSDRHPEAYAEVMGIIREVAALGTIVADSLGERKNRRPPREPAATTRRAYVDTKAKEVSP